MLVSLQRMRAGARHLVTGTLLLPLAACADGDLLLPESPDDRTPVQLRVVSGSGQAAPVRSPVPHPLVVEALDGAGRPAAGVVIVFEFVDPPNGATIAPPVSETDPEGRAVAEVVLGAPAGDQPVEARLDGAASEASVRFLLTAIRVNTGGGGGEDDDDDPPDGGGGAGGGGSADDDRGAGGKGKGGKGKGGGGNDDRDRDDDEDDEDDD